MAPRNTTEEPPPSTDDDNTTTTTTTTPPTPPPTPTKDRQDPPQSPSDDDNDDDEVTLESPSPTPTPPVKKLRMWRKPWMASLILFLFFFFLWVSTAVIDRYWVSEKWDVALPGLNTSTLRKHTMRMHLTLGAFALLLSPVQIVTPFTAGFKRKSTDWRRTLHRYTGRIYAVCAVLSYVLGQWFIVLKRFLLVGGYNMGIAFSFAGFAVAYFAYMTWKTAPRKDGNGEYTIRDHRNYAIRSFSQIIAPLLYRYWYLLLMLCNLYRTPYLNNGDPRGGVLVCDDRGVCDDYERPFDAIWCWMYWMSSWAVAEVIIVCLPDHEERRVVVVDATASGEGELTDPLLQDRRSTEEGESNLENDDVTSKIDRRKILVLNVVGCLLVVLTMIVSGGIMGLIFMKRVNMKEKNTSNAAIDVVY